MGRWGGFDERDVGGGRGGVAVANGFSLPLALAGGENGFVVWVEEVENGFILPLTFNVALVPKMLSPMF